MKLSGFITTALLSGLAVAASDERTAFVDNFLSELAPAHAKLGCHLLKVLMWDKIHYPKSQEYIAENLHFWSATSYASPACVFTPESADDVSLALRIATLSRIPLAVRGAGHLAIPGVSNVDSGVLIALSRLNSMKLNDAKSVVSIGPGLKWADVYDYLEPHGLVAVGGRLAPVGVSGLLLNGGVSYYSGQYGWAADNVVNYELVLPNGHIVSVNNETNTDLFWALKGGSSNYGIVTRFDLLTHHSPKIWAGIHSVSEEHMPAFLDAIAEYAKTGSKDPKSATAPAINSPMDGTIVGGAILFYDSDTEEYPECLKMFTDIPSISSSMGFKTLGEFTREVAAATVNGRRQVFAVTSTLGNAEGLHAMNSTFTPSIAKLRNDASSANSTISLTVQTITKGWLEKTAEMGGNPLGLDPEKAPYFVHAQYVEWYDAKDDDTVYNFVNTNIEGITATANELGVFEKFKYMGDATGGQKIIESYGQENVEKLKKIAEKYDPKGIWRRLLPGGFKVPGLEAIVD